MANEIQPAHLLAQARKLAGVDRGRGKPVTRAVQHASLASASRWIVSSNAAGTRTRAVRAARDFVTLYQARQRADYDHTAEFRKAAVLSLIDRADQVVAVAQQPRRGARRLEPLFAVAALSSRMLQPS